MRFIPFVTLLFTVSFGNAQINITGTVENREGQGIPLAHIRMLNSELGTTTDKRGNFNLLLPSENVTLRISAIGFATKTIIFSKETPLDIVLFEEINQLDDVVVSALKREEVLLKIPIAVSTLNAQKVVDTRTWDLGGLTALVPNYLYQESGVAFQAIQSIRGIQVFSENPAVATYVDDVNSLDILALGFQLTDIERIEVLRGPQGTLFGRNAMGGVVNIITKQPTNTTEGFWETGFGNLHLQRHSVGIKTPLVADKLYFGFSGLFQDRNGFFENDASLAPVPDPSLDGETVGDTRNLYGNLFFKWLISEKFNATLNVKSQKDWSSSSGFFVSQPNEEVAFESPDKIYLSRLASHDRTITNTALTLKYSASDFKLTSISTYQNIVLAFEDVDFPGFFHSFVDNTIGENLPPQEVWTQEFRINGIRPISKIDYTAGLFGFTQNAFEPSTNLAFEIDRNNFIISKNKGENKGAAIFGELTVALTDKFSVTGGIRYDYEERKAIFNGFGDLLFSNGILAELEPEREEKGTYAAISPKVAIAFTPTENSSIYASYNRGFRAGGINAQRLPEGNRQTFDEEYSDNFEVGYKMNTFHNTFNFSAAAFYIDWTDLQFFNLVSPGTFARENVGDARSLGFELEASAIPVNGLQLDASFGYTETEYKDFVLERQDFATGELLFEEISGNNLANTPGHTLFLGAQYTYPINKAAHLVFRGEIRNIGDYFTDIQNTLEQPTYTILNARVAFGFKRYTVAFWGQNLTDETFLSFGSPDTSFGSRSVRTAAPITYGATLTYRF
ncbi:MAG: TonB-dependent receptor [Saonia sp.]